MNPTTRLRQFFFLVPILLGAMVAAGAYLQSIHYQFIADDTVYIAGNARLATMQAVDLWRLFVEPGSGYSAFLALRDVSYWFDIHFFGLNPAAFRIHNIILYLLCLPLVYLATLELWRYFRPADRAAVWAAATVTTLFALQPSHAEMVVWISGRRDLLSTLFSLLAIWLALRARREHGLSVAYASATLVILLAALMSKVTSFPVALLIGILWLMFWRDAPASGRHNKGLIWPIAGMAAVAILTLVFAVVVPTRTPFYFGFEAITRSLAVLGWLARLSVSPESRHFFYPVMEDDFLPVMAMLGAAVLAAAVVSALAMWRGRKSLEGFSIVSFMLLCVPSIHLIPFQSPSLVSDRWLALAVWPAAMLLVALVFRLKPAVSVALLLVIALSWSVQTMDRPRDWRDLETLIDADIRAFPGFYLPAEHKIIDVQLKRGQRSEAVATAKNISNQRSRDVLIKFVNADYDVRNSVRSGNPQDAMTELWEVEQEINPPEQIKWNSAMRNFWSTIGFALLGEWEFLAAQFPDLAPVRYNAGLWMLKVHKYHEAVVHLRAATGSAQLQPSVRGTAYKNLGLALIGAGSVAAAEAPLQAALQQTPPDYRAYCALADVFGRTGRPADAARAAEDCRIRAPQEEDVAQ